MAEKKITYPFCLIDSSVMTNGVRVLVEGINLSQFEKNPVALYEHNDWKMPIGTWENIRKDNGRLMADFVPDYEDTDEEVQRVIGKVDRGIIKMASVGLVDLTASDDPLLQLEGQFGVTMIESRLREASIVAIGKNHNALRLYDRDGNELNLSDSALNLSDRINFTIITNKESMKKQLITMLNLSDKSTDEQVNEAVKLLLSDKEKAEGKVLELQGKLDAFENAAKATKKATALELTDAAIKDGRIAATAKESFLNAFDRDFEGTKTMLEGIAKPVSLKGTLESGKGSINLTDKSWDELDRSGKLADLKASDYDTYCVKFEEKFGKRPQ